MAKYMAAIVGRPNVGKSTLINRLAVGRKAIVDSRPGVTRDRQYITTDWRGREFILIDTGGIEVESRRELNSDIKAQALAAVAEADLILFIVDGRVGVTAADQEIAKLLHRREKPVLLIANKIDNPNEEQAKYNFYSLGWGEPLLISAAQGLGIGDLLDEIIAALPAPRPEPEVKGLGVALVGRPNAGKSSILNSLVGEERAIVSEVPGTTRDAVDSLVQLDERRYRLIDTAGLKKAAKSTNRLEYYGALRSIRALEEAEVALHVIDADAGVTNQDQRIAALIEAKGCAAVIILNKWDLLTADRGTALLNEVGRKLGFIDWALLLRVSALRGWGLDRIFPAVDEVAVAYKSLIPTVELNKFLSELKTGHLPSKGGKTLKLKYITQLRTAPPVFLLFVNDPSLAKKDFRRYLTNQFRDRWRLKGTPIKLQFRRQTR